MAVHMRVAVAVAESALAAMPAGDVAREKARNIVANHQKAMMDSLEQDEELRFRAYARRNQLIAAWVGEKLGKSSSELLAYRREVLASDLEEAGDDDVVRKLVTDLEGSGIGETEVRKKMEELLMQGLYQLSAET